MMIQIDSQDMCFKLDTPNTTYLIGITKGGHLINFYYGKHISDTALNVLVPLMARPYAPDTPGVTIPECPDTMPFEYGCPGKGDFRIPAIELLLANGDRTLDLRYAGYRLYNGKQDPPGQPHLMIRKETQADTLEILLKDTGSPVEVALFYSVFNELDAITRRTEIRNQGTEGLTIHKAMSASVPLHGPERDMIHLCGAWARERQVERLPLGHSIQSVGSTRGASGHVHNPFAAIVSRECTERHGDAYGFNLVYSGSFLLEAEVDSYDGLRVNAGIHPQGFAWVLAGGECFATPECVLVYSAEGLGGMSRIFHRLYRDHLCPPKWAGINRPVVINNWEATYFHFDGDMLVSLAKQAAESHIDLLVMDDGWFGKREDDTTSLGDWVVNEEKLGCTLAELARRVAEQGVQFGLWIEPEMVSEDSALYRAHPEWCLQTNREKTPSRNQFVLDFSRDEVLEYIQSAIAAVLRSAEIRYVKWDMNRNITDAYSAALPASRSGEVLHRYVLNVYRLAEYLTSEFPDILFEGCAGGGGRFDPAQLYYTPHIWTSDDMDPIERMKIQYGTSLVYPPAAMAAHVCSSPNHTTGRLLPLETRGHCAMMGGEFGYELDITVLNDAEKAAIRQQVETYKDIQQLIHKGDYYRLADPFRSPFAAWMFVDTAQTRFVLTYIQTLSEPNGNPHRILLDGLNPTALYREETTGMQIHGETLMNAGLWIPVQTGDFRSVLYRFSVSGRAHE